MPKRLQARGPIVAEASSSERLMVSIQANHAKAKERSQKHLPEYCTGSKHDLNPLRFQKAAKRP